MYCLPQETNVAKSRIILSKSKSLPVYCLACAAVKQAIATPPTGPITIALLFPGSSFAVASCPSTRTESIFASQDGTCGH